TFAALAVAQQALSVLATYLAENIGWAATNELRGDLAEHCLRLDMGFHKTRTPGEMIERIDGDVTALSNFFGQFVIHVVGNLVLLIGIVVLLFRENLLVGLGISVFAGVALVGMVGIQNVALPWWKRVRQRSAEFYGFLGEQLGGTEDIRSNGATGFFLRRFTEHLRAWLPDAVRGFMGWAVLWSTNIVVFAVGTALVFWLGSRLFGDGSLTIGSVISSSLIPSCCASHSTESGTRWRTSKKPEQGCPGSRTCSLLPPESSRKEPPTCRRDRSRPSSMQ
ncbi:MAG: ABC transporter transmembrane domain-containing protein, partial [Acidimicrobiia bacterium]